MAQKDLIPLNKRTKEEQKKITSKGGKASAKARKTQATFRDLLVKGLAVKLTEHEFIDELIKLGIIESKETIDLKTAISYARLFRELNNPTPEGFEKLMKAIGEEAEPGEIELQKLDDVLNKIGGKI